MSKPAMVDVIAPRDLYVVDLGDEVTAGQVVTVPAELAESLGWKPAPKTKPAKADDQEDEG